MSHYQQMETNRFHIIKRPGRDRSHWDAMEEEAEEAGRWNECQALFSGVDADVAVEIGTCSKYYRSKSVPFCELSLSIFSASALIEFNFRSADIPVFSSAKNFRRDRHVHGTPHTPPRQFLPLRHKQLLRCIVPDVNYSTTAVVVPLYFALERAFGQWEKMMCTTIQAINGAG
jgi:hypothetical protein